MIRRIYHINFLTPCFCAGADQQKAELRAASIRGQLRWWFRALGGSREEESELFGCVHGDKVQASQISVRVLKQPQNGQPDWFQKIPKQGADPLVYLWGFFCGRTQRLQPTGAIPPDSKAEIEILLKSPPTSKLQQTLRTFFSIGALGFRTTRAAGALTSDEYALNMEKWRELTTILKNAGFQVALLQRSFTDWRALAYEAGSLLKNKLRGRAGLGISAGQGGGKPNPLGSAKPRQASVLHLRPVRIDGTLRLALIEAPHHRILGEDAKEAHANRGPILDLLVRHKPIPVDVY